VVANDIPACCLLVRCDTLLVVLINTLLRSGALFIANYMADRFIAARNVPEQNPHLLEITAFA
jgi:hypothetical protein